MEKIRMKTSTSAAAIDPELSEKDQFFTEPQAAEYFGRSVRSMQRDRALGIGCRYVVIGGRSIRYRLSDMRAFADANTVKSTAEARQIQLA